MVAAPFSLTDASIWVAGYDMTGDSNKLSINASAEELETTVFGGGGYRSRIGGLKDVEANVEGFQTDAVGAVGEQLFPKLGTADEVWTVSPTGAVSSVAYGFLAGKFKVSQLGDIGTVAPFTLAAKGTNNQGMIRGRMAKAKGNVSATGALGTGQQLGAVGASSYLYAGFQVFSAGTTITVLVESDDNSGFTTPTTRGTFSGLTAAGGYWMTRVAGAITDDWFRFNVSVITGTFSVGGMIGIGS